MTTKIKELKQELKQLAANIRLAKAQFKNCQRKGNDFTTYSEWAKANNLCSQYSTYRYAKWPHELASDYRHMHIAYCLLRGRKYEEVEPKVKDNNSPSWVKIESILQKYREVEEVACAEVVNV